MVYLNYLYGKGDTQMSERKYKEISKSLHKEVYGYAN